MTTTRKAPATCIDCGRTLRSSNRSTTNRDMCEACFEYAGWENEHDDNAHDETGAVEGCPVCEGNAPTAPAPRTGHTDTAPRSWSSHAGHDHPATAKARAACRKAAKA
jgi:hypothetical protein